MLRARLHAMIVIWSSNSNISKIINGRHKHRNIYKKPVSAQLLTFKIILVGDGRELGEAGLES